MSWSPGTRSDAIRATSRCRFRFWLLARMRRCFLFRRTGGLRVCSEHWTKTLGTATVAMNFSNPTSSGLLQVIDFTRFDTQQSRVIAHQLNTARKWKTATASVEGYDEK